MKSVFIKYDPYEMRSEIRVDGKNIEANKHCDYNLRNYLTKTARLPIQSWIDPIEREGWKGLLWALCQMGDKKLSVEFSGRQVDYESVKQSLDAQNKALHCGAIINYQPLTAIIPSDSKMKANIHGVIDEMLTPEFKEIVNRSGSKALIEKYEKLEETYEQIEEEEFRIVFTGTFSSGKSSTINALIGKNLLPTATGTCTSRVCKIHHVDVTDPYATVRYYYETGETKDISCTNDEDVQNSIKIATENVDYIEVFTNLGELYPKGTENALNLVIVDTPGTNSATGNDKAKNEKEKNRLSSKSHFEITKEALCSKQKEMVVLISDEKLEDDSIVDILDIIEESSENDDGEFNDRFLFVMNMCDALEYSNEGETLENYVKNFIQTIKKVPNTNRNRNIVNPRVFPVSAGVALAVENGYTSLPEMGEGNAKKSELYRYYKNFCSKLYYYDELDDLEKHFDERIDSIKKEHTNYKNYCLEKQSAVSEKNKLRFEEDLNGQISLPQRVLIHSGIPALQTAIGDYISQYAYPIKVCQLLNCFSDILGELKSISKIKEGALEQAKKDCSGAVVSKEENERKKTEADNKATELNDINRKMKDVQERIDAIPLSIPHIDELRSDLFGINNSIAGKINQEVSKAEGDAIIADVKKQLKKKVVEIQETVKRAKNSKKEITKQLFDEFTGYLAELEKKGYLNKSGFLLKDTVEYKELADKAEFTNPSTNTRSIANKKKEHIQFGYGVSFWETLRSIGRWISTLPEPTTVPEQYYSNLFDKLSNELSPIYIEVDSYIDKLTSDYKNDIESLINDTKERMERVGKLIQDQTDRIEEIQKMANELANDETKYSEEVDRLSGEIRKIDTIQNKIGYTNINRR